MWKGKRTSMKEKISPEDSKCTRPFLSTDTQDVSGSNYVPSGAPGSPLRMRSRVATLALSVVITCVCPSRV